MQEHARTSDTTREDGEAGDTPWLNPPTSAEGVDLTQIRALKAMTPTERVIALKHAANALIEMRRKMRRVDTAGRADDSSVGDANSADDDR